MDALAIPEPLDLELQAASAGLYSQPFYKPGYVARVLFRGGSAFVRPLTEQEQYANRIRYRSQKSAK